MNELAERLLERLTETDAGQKFPTVRPRDAATMIIIDRSGATPKVLLGRRHHGHKFMPGKFVFPGGRMELLTRASSRSMRARSRRARTAWSDPTPS